jgi:excinuclease ABC subunit C
LLRTFGSVKRLRAASVDEIASVPGVGRRTAEAVHAALLDQPASAPAVDPVTGEILEGDVRTDDVTGPAANSASLPADSAAVGVGGSQADR